MQPGVLPMLPVMHSHRHWLFQSLCTHFCVTANENLKFSSGHALLYLLSSALYCFSDLHECPINQPGSNHINWNRNLRKNYFFSSVGFLYCIFQGEENHAIPSFLPIQYLKKILCFSENMNVSFLSSWGISLNFFFWRIRLKDNLL